MNGTATASPAVEPAELIGTAEAGAILKRAPRTVLRLAKAGHLRLNRPGNCQPLLFRSEVEALARSAGVLAP